MDLGEALLIPDPDLDDVTHDDHDHESSDPEFRIRNPDPDETLPPPRGGGGDPPSRTEIRRPGRPAKLRRCVGPCGKEKKTSEFKYQSDVCLECARVEREAQRTMRAEARVPSQKTQLLMQHAVDRQALADLPRAVLAVIAVPPVCACCREFRDVTPDPIGGAQLCPVCMFQIVRCGRCHTHGSRVFYSQLDTAAAPPPDVPPEVLHAYDLKAQAELAAYSEADERAPREDA